MLNNVDRLLKDVPVPKMFRAKQIFPHDSIGPDRIPEVIEDQIRGQGLDQLIRPGMRIAITAGSRGIANIPVITRAIVDFVKACKAEPFIVPAMGSHGGATAKGQKEMLKGVGIHEESMGCPVLSSMETVVLGKCVRGKDVNIDRNAFEADGIIVSCRIKPHSSYRYRYESGILKMMAVGLGKQKGAAQCHEDGVPNLPLNIESIAAQILKKAPILFAVATIENAFDETAKLVAVPKEKIMEWEPQLLQESKDRMPSILVGEADVLVIDEIGKVYSGSGTDPNITGTFSTDCASGGLKVQRTCMLDLHEASHGNALGTGLSNAITRRLFDKMDFDQMYPNCITSTVLRTAGIPVVMDSDLRAIQVCIKTCTGVDQNYIRMVRIPNSLHIEHIMLSEAYYEEVKNRDDMVVESDLFELKFDEFGNLMTPIV